MVHCRGSCPALRALAGVFKIAFACGLDPHRRSSAVDADRSCAGLGPDMDVFLALYSQDGQIRQPQYRINLGHGITSIELVFRTYKFNEYRRPPLMMKSQEKRPHLGPATPPHRTGIGARDSAGRELGHAAPSPCAQVAGSRPRLSRNHGLFDGVAWILRLRAE